jgi:predicted transcriptional regulator
MKKFSVLMLVLTFMVVGVAVYALSVGETAPTLQVRDSKNAPAPIPGFGTKVVTVFYNDKQASDITDTMVQTIKDKKYDEAKYQGQGIANLKDSKGIPDSIIRMVVRSKEKKFDSKILTDPEYLLKDGWKLGECNDLAVVVIIGKDKKVKYFQKFSSAALCNAQIPTVIGIIEAEMKK